MEFKGTKGKWINSSSAVHDEKGKCICITYENRRADALLISKAPEYHKELVETVIDLKILKNQIQAESKIRSIWDGMPELIQKWIDRKEQLIKEATDV